MSESTSDKQFYRIFTWITIIIIGLAIIIAILSKVFASSISNDHYDQTKTELIEKRISSSEKNKSS